MVARIRKKIGKSQAREELSSLIEYVSKGAGAVEITDHGKIAAVLLSEDEYKWLCACAIKNGKPRRDARGLIKLADEFALEKASEEVRADFEKSLEKTAREL